jgi:hypothetical protein
VSSSRGLQVDALIDNPRLQATTQAAGDALADYLGVVEDLWSPGDGTEGRA